jgi:ATP-dependent RNA helicase RhlE
MIGFNNWQQVLVFTRTKHGANRLAEQLAKDGLKSAAIHGNKTQAARTRALQDFKQGKVRVLVATDVASRGLDIDQLPHVVNFELPNVPEDYVHRIGRTGRAGNVGRAVSLVCGDEYPLLKNIERLLNQTLAKDVIPGYEPTAPVQTEADQPKRQRPNQRRSKGAKSQTPSKPTQSKPTRSQKPTSAGSAGTRARKRLRSA